VYKRSVIHPVGNLRFIKIIRQIDDCTPLDEAMKTGMLPIGYPYYPTMLNRIVMNVINMPDVICIVTKGVLPKTALPNSPFMAFETNIGTIFGDR
jgi:hypothetical protein